MNEPETHHLSGLLAALRGNAAAVLIATGLTATVSVVVGAVVTVALHQQTALLLQWSHGCGP